MTSRDRDHDARREAPPVPWYNRTSTLLGASVAAHRRHRHRDHLDQLRVPSFTEPEQAPTHYVEPTFSETGATASASTSTTTATVTSTSPPVTTDINPDLDTPQHDGFLGTVDEPKPSLATAAHARG